MIRARGRFYAGRARSFNLFYICPKSLAQSTHLHFRGACCYVPNDMRSQPREGSLVHLRRHQRTPGLRSRGRQQLRVGAGSRLLAAGDTTNVLYSLAACAHIHSCHMHSCLPRRQLVGELLIESFFPIRRRFRRAPIPHSHSKCVRPQPHATT